MSYIINNSSGFISIKLTETGRKKLAQGKLNFTTWGIGDSEINYDRELLFNNNQTDYELSKPSMILRPLDRQPELTSFITIDGLTTQNPLNSGQINTIKAIVSNKAKERGFFSADTTHTIFTTLLDDEYVQTYGDINNSNLSGGTTLSGLSGGTYNVGDFILIQLTNDTLGSLTGNTVDEAIPFLWYKIQSSGTTSVVVDRELPNMSGSSSISKYFLYKNGEVFETFGFNSTIPYWNTNTLDFEGCCDVSCSDVPVWNMNNVWCENIIGMSGTGVSDILSTPYESYEKFGSNNYMGQKYPYLNYSCLTDSNSDNTTICDTPGNSILDTTSKSISILHYSNNTISNYYGEFLHIDSTNNKTLKVHIPTIMYHRANFTTESGTTMGMTFISSGETKTIPNTEIEYVDLIEDPTKINQNNTPLIIGKVFPQLKIVVFNDDEIVSALSYKSNRNWTLPELSANLISPSGGTTDGMIQPNETMWLTYTLENTSGSTLTTALPCQKYVILKNNTSTAKDVEFKINDIDLLPYMRKTEKVTYDGLGFNATNFKVLYQILPDDNRPSSDAWKEHDFTTTNITTNINETIDPLLLENQISSNNGFKLIKNQTSGDTTFNLINTLNMAPNSNGDILQFGDERFFYGNIETYIGATIYKTVFSLNISADQFKFTTNPTRSANPLDNPPNIKMSECGIYDNVGDLVMIAKTAKPIELTPGNNITIELGMDF